MSQDQPHKPEAIKYGDVFSVSGELASKPVAPQDASVLQSAENTVLGQTPKGGPAAVMQSAADRNVRLGVVGRGDMTEPVRDKGATVAQGDVGGHLITAEFVGGQVVAGYGQPKDVDMTDRGTAPGAGGVGKKDNAITIGEALEATAITAGDKPIDQSDAAAIQAAESRATGLGHVVAGGVGAQAQSAVAYNVTVSRDEDKAKLGDVLTDATGKMIQDKPVTREDAEGIITAEIRNKPDMATHPGGVSATVAAAARLNMQK